MTVQGSDRWQDAPLLPLGSSSAPTSNENLIVYDDEPQNGGTQTAWWRVDIPTRGWHTFDTDLSTAAPGDYDPAWYPDTIMSVWRRENDAWTTVVSDDDGGENYKSREAFFVDTPGVHYVQVGAYPEDAAPTSYYVLSTRRHARQSVHFPCGDPGFTLGDNLTEIDYFMSTAARSLDGEWVDLRPAMIANSSLIGSDPLTSDDTTSYAEVDAAGYTADSGFDRRVSMWVSGKQRTGINLAIGENPDIAAVLWLQASDPIVDPSISLSIDGRDVRIDPTPVESAGADWHRYEVKGVFTTVSNLTTTELLAGFTAAAAAGEVAVVAGNYYDADVYRVGYLGVTVSWDLNTPLGLAPLRQFPRDDHLATSSARRVWPSSSQQATNRHVGYY